MSESEHGTSPDGRIPVYSVWQVKVGPMLSLGMLTAAARAHDGGSLNERYEIRRPELADSFLDDLRTRTGPAVLLCSDYVWSLEENIEVARAAKQICPQLVVIHGGPSSPKYPADAEEFLDTYGDVADVLVRGEGEVTICELLEALGSDGSDDASTLSDRLEAIPGLTYVDAASGAVLRTPDRDRLAALDVLPSPYLSGEFDHIDPSAWLYGVSLETNRGCPYGCAFCDWGSATQSRIRKFDIDRVRSELEWVAERSIVAVQLCDANFGITSRDVDIADHLASLYRAHRAPQIVAFTPAKNTSKYLTRILDSLLAADVTVTTAISLQTTDAETLDLVNRSNISTDSYLALAADLRRRGLPLEGDILLGLPGQTYETYKADLQFFQDHEISPRTWRLRLLPNAPMNAPEYRTRFDIATDVEQLVTSTSTMSVADRERMVRLRKTQVIATKFGVLRHVLNFVQWDHGISATDVLERIADLAIEDPSRFPVVSWVFEYFDLFTTVALNWNSFYAEIARLLVEDFEVNDPEALASVLALQELVMPFPGREFPASVELAHDYTAYYRSATADLFDSGHAGHPDDRLSSYPSVTVTVTEDPLDLCGSGLRFVGNSRDETLQGNFWIGIPFKYELPTTPQMTSTTLDSTALA